MTVNKWEESYFPNNRRSFELQNMIQTAKLIIQAALKREESRGAHYRKDFPYPDDLNWKKRITFRRQKAE
jgi:L-aspartate oxidase